MGQLNSYTTQDLFLITTISSVLSTYYAEEIEATIESIVAYAYSANQQVSKKKIKLFKRKVSAGDPADALQASFNLLGLTKTKFLVIEKPIDDKLIWQNIFLSTWAGPSSRRSVNKIEEKHHWNKSA